MFPIWTDRFDKLLKMLVPDPNYRNTIKQPVQQLLDQREMMIAELDMLCTTYEEIERLTNPANLNPANLETLHLKLLNANNILAHLQEELKKDL
jgi:hypothetical protein